MKKIAIATALIFSAHLVTASAQDVGIEKGLKNIRLFETTQTDIENIFSTKTGTIWANLYGPSKDDGSMANASFSKGPCVGGPLDKYRFKIDKDRLVAISVTTGSAPKFKDQKLEQKYTKTVNPGGNGWLYTNQDGSIVIWTLAFDNQDEIVFDVIYTATPDQKAKYKCP